MCSSINDYDGEILTRVQTNISFTWSESGTIRTLSTTDAAAGTDISGLLYTPVPNTTVCPQWSQYAPYNASKVVLPRANFGFVALAPWISPNCTLAYLAAVQQDPIRSFIFYQPGNSTAEPPLANDASWGLNDGGKWKSSNKFPVYAIPSYSGNQIMNQLALYTGNLTSVPNGHELANQFPPSDYIRLAIEIDIGAYPNLQHNIMSYTNESTAGGSNLPSLWVFLLIVLGILIIIIGSTSFIMHCVQRKRREWLRRRVALGEVDLEALGIKRLTVPQDILDKMPLYVYVNDAPATETDGAETVSTTREAEDGDGTVKEIAIGTERRGFTQPTCAICLDDFVSADTVVRELPCAHIFHPDCIDSFLRENSSLCPMCKKSVLPRGFCPAVVTNAMVRRERMVRRMRARAGADGGDESEDDEDGSTTGRRRRAMTLPRIRNAVVNGGRRVFSAPGRSTATMSGGVEMRSTSSPAAAATTTTTTTTIPRLGTVSRPTVAHAHDVSPPVPPNGALTDSGEAEAEVERQRRGRREWARQRALAMLGRNRTEQDDAIEQEARQRPGWRRVVGKVWPVVA